MKNANLHAATCMGILLSLTGATATLAASPVETLGQNLQQAGQEKIKEHLQQRGKKEHHHERHDNASEAQRKSICNQEINLRSIQGNQATRMTFNNTTNQEVRIYWLDYKGQRVFYQAIAPHAQYLQNTFKTHPWVITNSQDRCLDIVVSDRTSTTFDIR